MYDTPPALCIMVRTLPPSASNLKGWGPVSATPLCSTALPRNSTNVIRGHKSTRKSVVDPTDYLAPRINVQPLFPPKIKIQIEMT